MKAAAQPDLAIFHGQRAFANSAHVGRPNLPNREHFLTRVNAMLDRDWLSNGGPFVAEFERRIAEQSGTRHCVVFTNGTLALELLLEAMELRGEVLVPSFTFIATIHALRRRGLTPVFCDIDPRTACIDPARAAGRITPRTSAILGVHCWGHICDVDALQELAGSNRLELLFDAAHAFGCSTGDRPAGSFGRAEVFSFHATKFVHAGEGGAVTTNDDELNARLRLMKNFGFQGYDRVVCAGTNGKMTEMSAAMGLTCLESAGDFVAANARNRRAYEAGVKSIPGISVFPEDVSGRQNHQYMVLLVDESTAGLSRDDLHDVLHAENVLARRYFYPGCHRMEPYRTADPEAGRFLPETESFSDRVLAMPTGTQTTEADIATIAEILRRAVSSASLVRSHLAARRK